MENSNLSVKSDFLRVSMERGFFHQCSDLEGLDRQLCDGTVSGYIGFDCTASSFHIGNLVQIMRLHWLQKTGHRPIALMGGGTSQIGDPSGRDKTRLLLTSDQIQENKESLKRTFSKFIDFSDAVSPASMADNAEWLNGLNYIEMLRQVGVHFSVNRMISMDAVKTRLDRKQEMSFIEFNYTILQSFDFVKLRERYGCTLQMGGSDQWGNIVSGVDLGRRMGFRDLQALTCELITTSDGKKMGKSVEGAVWLNADMLSPYDYWQFWRNTSDDDVIRFLKLFTVMPMDEIGRLALIKGSELNSVKAILADETTGLLHGRSEAENAALVARGFFGDLEISGSAPTVSVSRNEADTGVLLVDLLMRAGFAKSKKDAKRHLTAGSVKVNGRQVVNLEEPLVTMDLEVESQVVLSMGRKLHCIVKLAN